MGGGRGDRKRLHTPQTGNQERLRRGYRVLAHVNCLSKSQFHTRDVRDGELASMMGNESWGLRLFPGQTNHKALEISVRCYLATLTE